jgi:multicomponent Na+:H+ antiporter subunit E
MGANTGSDLTDAAAVHPAHPGRELAGRLLLFGAVWILLAGTDPLSWLVGGPAVVAATWASQRLAQRARGLSFLGLLRFLPFFIAESVRGGLDVALRVLRPRMRISPGVQTYRSRLDDRAARLFFVGIISLLPGTLSADLRGRVVHVHALDADNDLAPELERLERRVADLFAQPLATVGFPGAKR